MHTTSTCTMWLAETLLSVAFLVTLGCCGPLQLTEETFQDTIGSGKPVFVKFFAPWCGHCKNLAPTWDELATKFTGSDVVIAKVDCTSDTKVCADNGVKGYPTLKLFHADSVWDHRGARDLQTLTEFVTSHTGKAEAQTERAEPAALTDSTFTEFITNTAGLHFVKFYAPWCGHCQRLAPVWGQLAAHFTEEPNVHISKVDCTSETATCQQYEVKGYPTLLLFLNGVMVDKFTGSRDLESLVQFVQDAASRETQKVKGVVVLDSESFSSTLAGSDTVFVKFYAPWCGHCKALAPTWDSLAEGVHGSMTTVTIAKVDCTVEKDICTEQQVHGYPTLVLFNGGERKEYKGARDINSLLKFIQENS